MEGKEIFEEIDEDERSRITSTILSLLHEKRESRHPDKYINQIIKSVRNLAGKNVVDTAYTEVLAEELEASSTLRAHLRGAHDRRYVSELARIEEEAASTLRAHLRGAHDRRYVSELARMEEEEEMRLKLIFAEKYRDHVVLRYGWKLWMDHYASLYAKIREQTKDEFDMIYKDIANRKFPNVSIDDRLKFIRSTFGKDSVEGDGVSIFLDASNVRIQEIKDGNINLLLEIIFQLTGINIFGIDITAEIIVQKLRMVSSEEDMEQQRKFITEADEEPTLKHAVIEAWDKKLSEYTIEINLNDRLNYIMDKKVVPPDHPLNSLIRGFFHESHDWILPEQINYLKEKIFDVTGLNIFDNDITAEIMANKIMAKYPTETQQRAFIEDTEDEPTLKKKVIEALDKKKHKDKKTLPMMEQIWSTDDMIKRMRDNRFPIVSLYDRLTYILPKVEGSTNADIIEAMIHNIRFQSQIHPSSEQFEGWQRVSGIILELTDLTIFDIDITAEIIADKIISTPGLSKSGQRVFIEKYAEEEPALIRAVFDAWKKKELEAEIERLRAHGDLAREQLSEKKEEFESEKLRGAYLSEKKKEFESERLMRAQLSEKKEELQRIEREKLEAELIAEEEDDKIKSKGKAEKKAEKKAVKKAEKKAKDAANAERKRRAVKEAAEAADAERKKKAANKAAKKAKKEADAAIETDIQTIIQRINSNDGIVPEKTFTKENIRTFLIANKGNIDETVEALVNEYLDRINKFEEFKEFVEMSQKEEYDDPLEIKTIEKYNWYRTHCHPEKDSIGEKPEDAFLRRSLSEEKFENIITNLRLCLRIRNWEIDLVNKENIMSWRNVKNTEEYDDERRKHIVSAQITKFYLKLYYLRQLFERSDQSNKNAIWHYIEKELELFKLTLQFGHDGLKFVSDWLKNNPPFV